MSAVDEAASAITNAYGDAVADLPVDDAIEVAERVISFVQAALDGLEDDLRNA